MSTKHRPVGPYSYDDDEDYVPSKAVKYSAADHKEEVVKKKAHTLDSDEEEEEEDYDNAGVAGEEKSFDVLKDDDIEGQEEQTVAFEGETRITPFNMREEMEEGHFDGDGFYHFKKDADVKDAWLDDIDWIKVKHAEANKNKYGSDEEEEEEQQQDDEDKSDGDSIGDDGADLMTDGGRGAGTEDDGGGGGGGGDKKSSGGGGKDDLLEVYRQMLPLLKPAETVIKALKRLGGGKKLTSAQKWKLKKQNKTCASSVNKEEQEQQTGDMQALLRLTELANSVVEAGNMDVYQETFEMVTVKLRPTAPAAPAMDMFSEAVPPLAEGDKEEPSGVAAVQWQLRWENKDDAEVHGPFPSTEMLKWQQSGYLDKGAYVRKLNDAGDTWYHSNRIDFDLYV